MATEKTEETSAIKNMTKQEMSKIIKTAKAESESLEKVDAMSICDVMKNNTSKVIQKIESKVPTYAQLYIDLYTKYLHTVDDFYGTCYLSEKEFFDNLGMDRNTIHVFDAYWKFINSIFMSQIDMRENFAKIYVQFRFATIDSYDKAFHFMMDGYARAWNPFNSYYKK